MKNPHELPLPAQPGVALVLLVDERPGAANTLAKLVDDSGAALVVATSVEEAAIQLEARSFAAVILNAFLPGEAAFIIAEQVRTASGEGFTPVVFLGDGRGRELVERAYAAGAADVLCQPLDPLAVRAKLMTFVRQFKERAIARGQAEQYRLLVDRVRDYAIFMLDAEGRVATWNVGAQRIKGYSADEIIGRHFSQFYLPEAVARGWPQEELRRAAAEGRFEDDGLRVRKDGTTFHANVVITALYDDHGSLHGFAKVTRDITDRKRAEENAVRLLQEAASRAAAEASAAQAERARADERRQREQLHVTLASIGDGVIVTDAAGTVTFLNPVAERLTSWPMLDAVGQPLDRIFHIVNEETRLPVENPVAQVLRVGAIVGLANHTVLIARDGREIPIDDSGAPIREVDGRIIGVVLVFRDVSEARRAFEARLHLAAIVESSDDAIISNDLNGVVVSWNTGAERLYGYSAQEMIGQSLERLVPSDHPDELPKLLERIKRGEQIEHFETVRLRCDGTRRNVSLTISPVKNAGGRVTGASKIARDITARKQAEAALREADRQKDEFLATLAHELRNPLAPIRNALHILRHRPSDPAMLDRACEIAERQVRHMSKLLDDLLDVSRISRGRIVLHRETIDLVGAARRAVEAMRHQIEERGLRVQTELAGESLLILGDPTRLEQVVTNLLNNAIKFTDPGGRISVAVERDADEAVLRVSDNGIGIDSEMLPRVFELFVQAERRLERSQGGVGIGLTLVKRLVEMHGGNIRAHSRGLGQGSEFTVRLPRMEGTVPAERNACRDEGASTPLKLRILVVDDNEDAADSLGTLLTLDGHDVRTAYDGHIGLAQATEFRPHFILLDIGMPGMNGLQVARQVHARFGRERPTLVAMTGWGQEVDRRQSHEAGFDAHLVKPVEPDALRELLSRRYSE